jgi:hypothetical protein
VDARKPARESAKRNIARQAAAPADLSALLAQADKAAAEIAGSPARLESWAKEHAAVVEPGTPSAMAQQLCDYITAADDFKRIASELAEHERQKKLFRQRQGRRNGALRAAVAELNALHAGGLVTDREHTTLTTALDKICARTVTPELDPMPKASRATTGGMLGSALMSLFVAVGYGSAGHKYSKKRAAEIVARILRLHGYTMSIQALHNMASTPRETKKK